METTHINTKSWSSSMAQKSLQRTSDWINQFGSRLAGSAGCRSTAEALFHELNKICKNANLEPFITRPTAFGKFLQVDALMYLVGAVLILLNKPLLAAFLLTADFVAAGLQFGYYREVYDWLYPQAECQNVSAVLEPRETVKQQLIISGHHDAAQEYKFLTGNQKLYGLKILIPDIFRMLGCLIAWALAAGNILSVDIPGFMELSKIVVTVGVYFIFTKFNLFTRNVSPGAGDNLIASNILVELAAHFCDLAQSGVSKLHHTRLIFVSFDAEESGLRGSRAWTKTHQKELKSLPTMALNIDSIYHLRDLQFMVSDLNNHICLDQKLAEDCVQTAQELGYPAKTSVMRFGGGGTDAAELAKAGVRATTMIAMSTDLVRDGLVYHTMSDTVDAIEPEAVSACLEIAGMLAFNLDLAA